MSPNEFLDACAIEPAVLELRPDYRVQLLVVDGLSSNLGSDVADDLIRAAQDHAQVLLAESAVDQLPHIAAWREAYRAFGAKPQRTRNSLEALTRRAGKGCPGSMHSPTSTTRSRCCTRSRLVARTSPCTQGLRA